MAANRFKGRYRIASAHWDIWDFGRNVAYFITICTAARTLDFGRVVGGEMELSALGHVAWAC